MKHKVGRHIPHMQVDAGRAALQQTPSDNTAPRGGQEDEARPGNIPAAPEARTWTTPRDAHP